MGFQGSLASVNLADIFQTLAMNRQTGTLVVRRKGESHHIWFEQGEIALADGLDKSGGPLLLSVLVRRGLLNPDQAGQLEERLYQSRQDLRDLILSSGLVVASDLDEVVLWCIEDLVCTLFEWEEGDFSFIDGEPVEQLAILELLRTGEHRMPTSAVVMEATRRRDEWERIRELIPDTNGLYIVDNEGRNNLRAMEEEPDADMLKVLRYLDGKHGIEEVGDEVGLSRFDTCAIVAQFLLADVARPCSPQEVVDDALALRKRGEKSQARALLEHIVESMPVPEVIRPLAELVLELGDKPRAVELYLELIQRAQDDGDAAQALSDIDIVIGINPDDPDLHIDRADVLLDLNRATDAAEAYIAAATTFLAMRETKLAMDACHRAKDLAPTSPDPHRLLARCYLLDNQAENAVVEYKSLWHTLLAHHRPRRALEELRRILEEDCKYPRIKEQVIDHAAGSEIIRTGAALRLLVYLVCILLLTGAGVAGYHFYENHVASGQRDVRISALDVLVDRRDEPLDFPSLMTELHELKSLTGDAETLARIDALTAKAETRYQAEAEQLGRVFADHLENDELDQAAETLRRLIDGYPLSNVAAEATAKARRLDDRRALLAVRDSLQAIKSTWASDQWQDAIDQLSRVINTEGLTPGVRQELNEKLENWRGLARNAEFLFRRAEALERQGRTQQALDIFARAMRGEGERFRDLARAHLIELERRTANDRREAIATAIEQQDSQQIFRLLDDLRRLAENAHSQEVSRAPQLVRLPFLLTVGHHRSVITVRHEDGTTDTYRAAEDIRGPWTLRLEYPATGRLMIEASRSGFSTQRMQVAAVDRRIAGRLELSRGPLRQIDLSGRAATDLLREGQHLLVGTAAPMLDLIDLATGTRSSVTLDEQVASFSVPPLIFRNRAYIPLGGRIHAIDLITKGVLWSWPSNLDMASPNLARSGIWVQDHELIQGQYQIFAGASDPSGIGSGRLLSMVVENEQIASYPPSPLDHPVTAPMISLGGVLAVPAGPNLIFFDVTSGSRTRPLRQIGRFRSRGEITVRPVACRIGGRSVLLVADATGFVVAIDPDPGLSDDDRTIMAWTLDGRPSAPPVLSPDGRSAYLALAERGQVVALDLQHSQSAQLRWRFPPQGRLGAIPGRVAIGERGLYAADATGILVSIAADSGQERWRVDMGSPAASGVLAHGGRIYVATHGGHMLCFEEGED